MAELRGLGDVNAAIKQKNGSLFALSVDPPEQNKDVIDQNALAFSILSDRDRTFINQLGLVHPKGGPGDSSIAIPAHLLIDEKGVIRWYYVSKRVQDRPDPAQVVGMIEGLD